MLDSVWLVPLCPLLGAMLNGFFGRRYSRETVGQLGIAAVGVAFLISLMTFIVFSESGRTALPGVGVSLDRCGGLQCPGGFSD